MAIVTETLADGTVVSGPAHEVQAAIAEYTRQHGQNQHANALPNRTGGVAKAEIGPGGASQTWHADARSEQAQRPAADIFDTARTAQAGFPVSRHEITDDTVLRTAGGAWSVRSLLQSGELQRLADGTLVDVATGARSSFR